MKRFTLKENQGRGRFKASPWFSSIKDAHVLVIGAGGIGSWVTMYLAKLGCKITLFDDDTFDINNLGGQLAPYKALQKNKAEAIAKFVTSMLGLLDENEPYVDPFPELFEEGQVGLPIMFCCVDNMEARKAIYESWKAQEDRVIFIDGRMGAEQFEIYVATKEQDNWMDSWFPDSEAAELPCAYRATSHVGSAVAAMMIQAFTNFFNESGDTPQSFIYNGPMLKTEVNYG